MRRAPWRPNNEITQQYNDGCVNIYRTSDKTPPGYQVREALEFKFHLYFANMALGINRIYKSRQNQAEIVKVIRVPKVNISPQDVAIIHDGTQYRIDTVQEAMGVYPPSLDLSLTAIKQKLEVIPK